MSQTNTLETLLKIKTETTQAQAAVKALGSDFKNLNREATEAQKAIDNLARSNVKNARDAEQYIHDKYPPALKVFEDQRKRQQQQQHVHQPQAYVPTMTGSPAAGGSGKPGNNDSLILLSHKAAMAAAALATAAAAAEKFTGSMNQTAGRVDAAGHRLGGAERIGISGLEMIHAMPIGGSAFRAGSSIPDFIIENDPIHGRALAGLLGIDRNSVRDTREWNRRQQLNLAMLPDRLAAEDELQALRRRGRSAHLSAIEAEMFGASERARWPQTAAEMRRNELTGTGPEWAAALKAERRAQFGVGVASAEFGNAEADEWRSRRRIAELQRELNQARGSVRPGTEFFSQISPTVANMYSGQGAQIKQREVELMKEYDRLQDAVNRKQEAEVHLAQSRLNAEQASLGVLQQRLTVVDRAIMRTEGGTVQYSLMDPWEKASLMSAAERANTGGIGMLSKDERMMLLNNSITGEWARQKTVQAYEGNDELARLQQIVGSSSLPALRKQQVELNQQIEFRTTVNEDELAKATDRSIEQQIKTIERIISDRISEKFKILEVQMNSANALLKGINPF